MQKKQDDTQKRKNARCSLLQRAFSNRKKRGRKEDLRMERKRLTASAAFLDDRIILDYDGSINNNQTNCNKIVPEVSDCMNPFEISHRVHMTVEVKLHTLHVIQFSQQMVILEKCGVFFRSHVDFACSFHNLCNNRELFCHLGFLPK